METFLIRIPNNVHHLHPIRNLSNMSSHTKQPNYIGNTVPNPTHHEGGSLERNNFSNEEDGPILLVNDNEHEGMIGDELGKLRFLFRSHSRGKHWSDVIERFRFRCG